MGKSKKSKMKRKKRGAHIAQLHDFRRHLWKEYKCPICKTANTVLVVNALGEPVMNMPIECPGCKHFYYLTMKREGLFCHKKKLEDPNEKKVIPREDGNAGPGRIII